MAWRYLKKLGIKPPYDPAIPLLGIYPEETKTEEETCIPLFIAALFTIARTWKSYQLCPTLCDPTDGSPPGSTIPGILQARTLEWAAISFSNVWKLKSESEVAQSCLTLHDPMDCSLPGSSAHGIFQARVLEWVAIAFSWKQPRCPSREDWIKKLWYIYIMEYCSAMKRKAFESVLMKWMNP